MNCFNPGTDHARRRKVAAMGGMSAQIPIKDDPKANDTAMEKVRADKLREVTAGHDGTWVAHPFLIKIALAVFDEYMHGPNQVTLLFCGLYGLYLIPGLLQYHVRREDVKVTAADLLNTNVPGKITEAGLRANVSAALAYTTAWIGGNGCVPINHLMEDAATAEISRASLWQWVKYQSKLESGLPVTAEYVDSVIDELSGGIPRMVPNTKEEDLAIAVDYLKGQIRKEWPGEFLTSDLMPHLVTKDGVESK